MNKTKKNSIFFQLGFQKIKSKKAIELSINFLVIVIISLVMLSSGILIVQKYFGTAEEIQSQLDTQTIAQIEELLDEGDPVAIPLKRKTISAKESDIFGLGVINIYDTPTSFTANIIFSNAYKPNKEDITAFPKPPEEWLLYDNLQFNLEPKEKRTISIRVDVPAGATSGTYIYNVKALPYDRITKMYVIVP